MTFLKSKETGEWYESHMSANRLMASDIDELGCRVAASFYAENIRSKDSREWTIGWRCWVANYPRG